MKKVAVLGSGSGSNFEAIVKYFKGKDVCFTCISNKLEAYILDRARRLNIERHFVAYEETHNFLKNNDFDLIVLAGYMRVLPPEVVNSYKIVNIHPSLLPDFKGMSAIEKAFNAKVKITGVSVHFVNEEVDAGEIIAQIPVKIEKGMTLEELEAKIHSVEHYLFPRVIESLLFETPLDIKESQTCLK